MTGPPPTPAANPAATPAPVPTDAGRARTARSALRCAAFGGLVVAFVTTGYLRMQLCHDPGDDEGFFVYTAEQFARGEPLYDVIPSQYGPAHYLLYRALAAAVGGPVTHDLIRVTSLALHTVGCLLWAAAAGAMTGRVAVAAAAFAAAFTAAHANYTQPGHPAAVGFAAVAGAVAAAALPGRAAAAAPVAVGAAVGLALLSKPNIGVFLGAAAGWWLLTAMPAGPAWTAARLAWSAGMAAMPAVLLWRPPPQPAFRDFTAAAIMATVSAAWASRGPRPDCPGGRPSAAIASAAAGFGLVVLAAVAATAACGTTAAGWAEFAANVANQADMSRGFARPPPLTEGHMHLAVAGLATAVVPVGALLRQRVRPALAFAAFAVVAWESYGLLARGIGPSLAPACALPFAWLVAEPAAPSRSGSARVLLAVTAAVMVLVAYPLAYAQWAFSLVPAVVATLVAVSDVAVALREKTASGEETAPSPESAGGPLPSARRWAVVALGWVPAAALAALTAREAADAFTLTALWTGGRHVRPVALRGLESARLPEDTLAVEEWAVLNIRAAGDSVVTVPGTYSLCAWSGIPSATRRNAGAWPFWAGQRMQEGMLEDLRGAARLCGIRQPAMMAFWGGFDPPPDRPAWRFVDEEMEIAAAAPASPAAAVTGYELLQPRRRSGPPLRLVGAEWVGRGGTRQSVRVRVTAPIAAGERVAAIRLVALRPGPRRPALGLHDALSGDEMIWDSGLPLPPDGQTLDEPRTWEFDVPAAEDAIRRPEVFCLVRLVAPDGRTRFRLPMMDRRPPRAEVGPAVGAGPVN
jgi:hypothetical protein